MDSSQKATVLVVDDDAEVRYSLQRVLGAQGYKIIAAASGPEGVKTAVAQNPAVIFLDNRMGSGPGGIETLQKLRAQAPRCIVVLMTAFGTTQTAIEAMKFGAFDYILKPFDRSQILTVLENALRARTSQESAGPARASGLNSEDYQEGLVGSSAPMREVFKTIGQAAATDLTVMITGESGTGKEVVARTLSRFSLRATKPFIAVNCAAIPPELIESELFGHEKGSFTGAVKERVGCFEQADGGTLFLDEIGDMSPATQTKILRALQEREIQRVGGSGTRKVDVRLIAATNRDLEKMVSQGTFREDLYYRLNVVRIRLPSLRERTGDIAEITEFLLQRSTKGRGPAKKIVPEAVALLSAHDWPGNIRELENVVARSAAFAQGDTILAKDVEAALSAPRPVRAMQTPVPGAVGAYSPPPPEAPAAPAAAPQAAPSPAPAAAGPVAGWESLPEKEFMDKVYAELRRRTEEPLLDFLARELMSRVLAETKGNQVRSSNLLGITRATLRKRLQEERDAVK